MMESDTTQRTTQCANVIVVLVASLSLIPFTYLSLSDSANAPAPLLALLPLYIVPYRLALFLPAFFFLLWNGYLLRGRKTVPSRTSIGFFLLCALTILHFVTGWSAGVAYQGISHTKAVCIINLFAMLLLWPLWYMAVKIKRYLTNLVFSWILFLWLSWQAFPYFGEW